MVRATASPSPEFRQGLLETYAVNDRINQLILENLIPRLESKASRPQQANDRGDLHAHAQRPS